MTETFVLIGGWTRSAASYQKLVSSAPKNCKIIIIPHSILERTDIAASLHNHLSKLGIIEFALIGHSLGGAIAMEYASLFPQGISNLYLVDSEGVYGGEKLSTVVLNFLKTRIIHSRKMIKADLVSFYSVITNPFLHFRLARYAHFANHEEYLRSIKIPTTILWGEKDHVTPVWQGKKINELIKNSKMKVIASMDHDWIIHKPGDFWKNV